MDSAWPVLLFALGGLLLGGAWSVRTATTAGALSLGACAAVALAAGVLRLGG
ncbi:hypothetical protein FHX37_1877 [Haloactinospora alba]|uniref:Uncharacterized protein n=1 Tax=Haloactinospora alba TaxID=405555 RepID=A0A543NJA7_9ACTN|nr:hypothetical protein [Haloactinospora alba]TQN31953.1 hypothetical protein FHX37_1877 [Haloactinospora alba]